MDKSANFGKKRIKAKVGKRAPKKLNATDTAFRTATVDVRPQSVAVDGAKTNNIAEEESLELISSRGKTLQQLLPSLSHHAANVRNSALQGLRDALQRKMSITKNNTTSHAVISASIKTNLPVLMPSLSRCLVDEDTNVRSCTITIFRELVPYLCNTIDSSSKNKGNNNNNVMVPFLPLAMAYVISALNSLDDDLRYDGCLAIELFYTHYGSTMLQTNSFVDDKNLHPKTILPAFVRVLTDASIHRNKRSSRSSSSSNNKRKALNNDSNANVKIKKNENSDNNRSIGVLKSFISLLQCSASNVNYKANHNSNTNNASLSSSFFAGPYSYFENNMQQKQRQQYHGSTLLPSLATPDLIYLPNAPKQNALILFNNNYNNKNIGENGTSISNKTDLISIQACIDILNKLRDHFLELTQHNNNNNNNNNIDKGLSVSISHLEEFSLLVTSFRLLWKQHGSHLLFSIHGDLNDTMNDNSKKEIASTAKLYKISCTILSHFMECFPLLDDSGNPNNVSRFQHINASICSIISEFGSSLVLYGKQKQIMVGKKLKKSNSTDGGRNDEWVNSVFSYLLPQLEKREKNYDKNVGIKMVSDSKQTPSDYDENNVACTASVTLLKVVGQLLLGQQVSPENNLQKICNEENKNVYYYFLLDDERKRLELLGQFGQAFFLKPNSTPHTDNDDDFFDYTSTTARRATMLLCALLTQQRMENQNDNINVCEDNCQHKKIVWQKLLKLATLLPYYLAAWGGSFPLETNVVLGVIFSIIRTSNSSMDKNTISMETDSALPPATMHDDDVSKFVNNIQSSMTNLLFEDKKVKNIIDKRGILCATTCKVTVFEQLQDTSQQLLLSMIGLLRNTMDSIVLALARICSRRNVSLTLQDLLRNYPYDDKDNKRVKGAHYHHVFVNEWIVEYTLEVLHSIRFTISKQIYFTFLINSLGLDKIYKLLEMKKKDSVDDTGVSKGLKRKREANETIIPPLKEDLEIQKMKSVIDERDINSKPEKAAKGVDFCDSNPYNISDNFDKVLALVCRYLSECGGMEVLKVLNLVIKNWIEKGKNATISSSITSSNGCKSLLLYVRSATAVLSTFSWNELSRTKSTGEDSPRCIYDFMTDIEESLTFMICNSYLTNNCDDLQLSYKFMAPVKVLLSTQPKVFHNVLNVSCKQLCSDSEEISHTEKKNLMLNMRELIKSSSLQEIIQTPYCSNELLRVAAKLEDTLSKTSLDRIAAQLRIDVQGVLGLVSTKNTQ